MLVQLNSVDFDFAGETILSNVTWQVNRGDKIGLVGPNGCGKTTVLRLMAGELVVERGEVARLTGCRVGYLKQEETPGKEERLEDALLEPFGRVLDLNREVAALEAELVDRPSDPSVLARYGRAQHEYEALGGYGLRSRVQELVRDL
jgi:ATPase subunit of ABC transporter with duplicated ATPase domains